MLMWPRPYSGVLPEKEQFDPSASRSAACLARPALGLVGHDGDNVEAVELYFFWDRGCQRTRRRQT